jgi:hypothetical protein
MYEIPSALIPLLADQSFRPLWKTRGEITQFGMTRALSLSPDRQDTGNFLASTRYNQLPCFIYQVVQVPDRRPHFPDIYFMHLTASIVPPLLQM